MSVFLNKYLEWKLPEVLRKKFPELYFDNGMYCPQSPDLPDGASYISVETIRHLGQAALMSGVAQDIPVATIDVGQETYKAAYIVGKVEYSDPEIRAAKFAQSNGQIVTDFQEERLIALRRMIDIKSHELCAFGAPSTGLLGFLNHPEVPLSQSSTYRMYAPNATAQNIIDFITSEIHSLWSETNFVESPNVLLVPPTLWKVITSTYRTAQTDKTVKDALMQINPSLEVIAPIRELASETLEAKQVHTVGTNKDRMMIYNLSPDNVKRHFNPLHLMQPQLDGMLHGVIGYKGVSSVRFSYPKSARYVDFPISTANN